MSKEKISLSDIQHPLYLHPSEGPNSISVEKLQGANDYRAWRRSMEISLAAKRKLGFVTGIIKRESEDTQKADQWDTCNNMVIAWLHGSVSEHIKKTILYLNTAVEVWKHLEAMYNVTNGSRKYKIERDIYEMKQNDAKIHEYYAAMRGIWEEQDALNILPPITEMNAEVNNFVQTLNKYKEEQRLF